MKRSASKIHCSLLLAVGTLLISCGGGRPNDAAAQDTASKGKAEASGRAARVDGDSKDVAATSELKKAEQACRDGSPEAFFDAFIQSQGVRQKYTAQSIEVSVRSEAGLIVSRQSLSRRAYAAFPIIMVDYYRKPADRTGVGASDEYIMLDINRSQSDQLSVEWTTVRYEGITAGGDDLGEPVTLDGSNYVSGSYADGQLLFEPVGDCWELVSDLRYEHGGR